MRQVHGAICAVDGKQTFTDVTLNGLWTGWSGFADTFDQRHRHQVGPLVSNVTVKRRAEKRHGRRGTLARGMSPTSSLMTPGRLLSVVMVCFAA